MIRSFAQTENVATAAALAVCGVPIVTEPTLDERTGQVRNVCRISSENVAAPKDARLDPREILRGLKAETLEERDPGHPALAALWALHNEAALQALADHGTKCRLVAVRGIARAWYDDAPALEPAKGRAVMATPSIAVAAALGVVGVPVCGRDEGPAGRWRLWAKGHPLVGEKFRVEEADAVALVRGYRDQTLEQADPWHPFLVGVQAISAAAKLRAMLGQGEKRVALRPPGSKKSAVIREQANDRSLDRVRRFFRIG